LFGALKEAASFLERRFLLNAFFPSLIFWGALLLAFLAPDGGINRAATAWAGQSATVQIAVSAAYLAWTWFWAGIIASQWRSIVRLYEGYWNPRFDRLTQVGRNWHIRQLLRLYEDEEYEALYYGYPYTTDLDEVMPTRFGNILKNAELYPRYRYQADAVLLWPRLTHLVPERFNQILSDARAQVEFLLVISTLSTVFALVAGVYLLVVGASWWIFLACFWGGLFLAFGTYLGSLNNALVYAQQFKAGFDLYRMELLRQMRLEPQDNLATERELWDKVYEFLLLNRPPGRTYTHEPPMASSDEA
jgi:hypothetical protein